MFKPFRLAKAATLVIGIASLLTASLAQAQADAPPPPQTYEAKEIFGKTEVERAIGKCVAAVVGGAILGAMLGAMAKHAGDGAALGAAAGAGACAVMMSVASKKDKEQIRALQLTALNSRQSQTAHWTTEKGEEAAAYVTTSNIVQVASKKSAEPLQCTRTSMNMTVGQAAPSSTSDVFCLQGDKWVSAEKLKGLGVDPSSVTA